MIELRGHPRRGVVAHLASLRETLLRVVRVVRVLIVLQVAGRARLVGQVEVPVGVALIALQSRVHASQGEAHNAVIEIGRLPGGGRVALLACLRHAGGNVIGIRGFLIIRQVTAHTVCRSALISPADVARRAVQCRVHAGQRKPGKFQMVEFHSHPRVHVVTLNAAGRKARGHVVGAGSLLERLSVAGVAIRRHRSEIAQRAVLVARLAVQRGMSADQRKTVVMVLDRFQRDVPSIYRVTLFAARSHAGAMNVSVTVGALAPDIGEHRLDMTLRAHHVLVHAT